jgi:hypothetical protein
MKALLFPISLLLLLSSSLFASDNCIEDVTAILEARKSKRLYPSSLSVTNQYRKRKEAEILEIFNSEYPTIDFKNLDDIVKKVSEIDSLKKREELISKVWPEFSQAKIDAVMKAHAMKGYVFRLNLDEILARYRALKSAGISNVDIRIIMDIAFAGKSEFVTVGDLLKSRPDFFRKEYTDNLTIQSTYMAFPGKSIKEEYLSHLVFLRSITEEEVQDKVSLSRVFSLSFKEYTSKFELFDALKELKEMGLADSDIRIIWDVVMSNHSSQGADQVDEILEMIGKNETFSKSKSESKIEKSEAVAEVATPTVGVQPGKAMVPHVEATSEEVVSPAIEAKSKQLNWWLRLLGRGERKKAPTAEMKPENIVSSTIKTKQEEVVAPVSETSSIFPVVKTGPEEVMGPVTEMKPNAEVVTVSSTKPEEVLEEEETVSVSLFEEIYGWRDRDAPAEIKGKNHYFEPNVDGDNQVVMSGGISQTTPARDSDDILDSDFGGTFDDAVNEVYLNADI